MKALRDGDVHAVSVAVTQNYLQDLILGYKFKLSRLIAYVVAIAISLLLSFCVSQSNFHNRADNDLPAYENFYYCLKVESVDTCRLLISSNYEYAFYWLFGLISFTGLSFSLFLFLLSFLIYSMLLFFVIRLSSKSFNLFLFSLLFLLVDFRFYDYGFNILRHGFASVMMMFATLFYILNSSKFRYAFLFSPVFFHLSAVAQLVLILRTKLLYSRVFWFFLILILYLLGQYLPNVLSHLSGLDYVGDKLSYYIEGHRNQDWLPLQYMLVLVLSLLFDIKNSTYLIVRQVFLVLVAISMVFISTGMSYRFIAFSMPFAAILITYHISYFIDLFERRNRFLILLGLSMCFTLYAVLYFYKYNEFILGGLI
ncbi:EpsG family protein [Vibrio cholerae]|uniref:EpsG family protein n=1 Tax=Vibrio cholerae TaxID=666 RepID=UPI0009B218B1|nr:EpsG family protein [Vibrio cholerae]TQP45150.1 hypothetical protein FLM09_08235 [Vibrio cholerae]